MAGDTAILQLQNLTGGTPAGKPIAVGEQIFTVDANEAGETRIVGAKRNGPIFVVVPQGDYAFVLKERSIQSMRYTGQGSGTFTINPELSGEGPISRKAWCDLNDGRLVFLGHKEMFTYTGGPSAQPVCTQFTRELFATLDRTRLNQLLMYHLEQRNEVWTVFPVAAGGFRVLIWNYFEDTATLDDYDADIMFTAINYTDWVNDVQWGQVPFSVTWATVESGVAWEDAVAGSEDHLTLLASADGGLRIYGLPGVYDREGKGYLCVSETMDFSFDDWDQVKYVDVVVIGIQVSKYDPANPATMYVQVGGSTSLSDSGETDTNIVWTDPQPVLVNGAAVEPIKVNPGGAGRYLRVRFSSSDPGVQWRVTSFEIHCRGGGYY
jgi:hypothetical protein